MIYSFYIVLFWPKWDSKLSLGIEMTQLNKFEDINGWFLSLGTEMTQPNMFENRDNSDEEVWRLKWSIWKFRDRNNTTIQLYCFCLCLVIIFIGGENFFPVGSCVLPEVDLSRTPFYSVFWVRKSFQQTCQLVCLLLK